MRVGVVGLGHVGLVSAACFAHTGHEVLGFDSDEEKLALLGGGQMPFFEPGLAELVAEGLSSGRLEVASDLGQVVEDAEVIFICVGTPATPTGEADLTQVERLSSQIAGHLKRYVVLVEKSTVPTGTGARIAKSIERSLGHADFDVVSNPEFLREGSAVADTLHPDRIVIGSSSERATELVKELYRPIIEESGCAVVVTDVGTAELIKHASNAFLATKISFINAIAEICEATGSDVETVSEAMGYDPRIGAAFLRAGVGYGGSCFPKDVAAFASVVEQLGLDNDLLEAVQKINDRAPRRILDKLRKELWHLQDKDVAVLGLAFKPGTDDLREAPALKVIAGLLDEGARVTAYDPVAMPRAKEMLNGVRFADSALDAMKGAHAALFLTDWNEFRGLDLTTVKSTLRFPLVVDGRNLFSPATAQEAGLTYISVGRPAVHV